MKYTTIDFLSNTPIAHRGLHDETKPENSLAAVRAAVEKGYPVETDVHLTKDGEVVVFHDDNLKRMTGVDRELCDCTLAELKELRLGGTDEQIPLFTEFLDTVGGKVPILLEVKNMPKENTKECIRKIADVIKGYSGKYAMQSFNPFYVKEYKKVCPDIPCGILASASSSKADFGGSKLWRLKARTIKNMSFNGLVKPDFISYYFADYPQKSTERYKGFKLAWTIRSADDEAYARKYANNIIFERYIPAEAPRPD